MANYLSHDCVNSAEGVIGELTVPGNGGGDIFAECMWYRWVYDKITTEFSDLSLKMRNMPDPVIAREKIWVPFMRDEMKIGENSVIIGHSSGAVAAIRFSEIYKVHGIILVGAYTTDCGLENERLAGYFNRPWLWDKARENTNWIVQFGSEDDPFLDWNEQLEVSKQLNTEFHKFKDRGHFQSIVFPEVIKVLKDKIK
uniref:serine hydrolase RBBP9-like n=1 Tax=Styela clava TaxID=7725 RepID=UPI00193A92A8|nr:serine hydrolase RBBP9-like [Styela clava]